MMDKPKQTQVGKLIRRLARKHVASVRGKVLHCERVDDSTFSVTFTVNGSKKTQLVSSLPEYLRENVSEKETNWS